MTIVLPPLGAPSSYQPVRDVVLQYGVPNNNTGDASVGINQAIQDELAAMQAVGSANRGSVVYLPPGIYRCLNPIVRQIGQWQVTIVGAGVEATMLSFPNDLSFTATCNTHGNSTIDGFGSFSGGHTITDVKVGMGVSGPGIPELATIQTVNTGTSTITLGSACPTANAGAFTGGLTGQPIRLHPFAVDASSESGFAEMLFGLYGISVQGPGQTIGGISGFTCGVKVPSGSWARDVRVRGFGYGLVLYGDHCAVEDCDPIGNGFNVFLAPAPAGNVESHHFQRVRFDSPTVASIGVSKLQHLQESFRNVHFGFGPIGVYQVNDRPDLTGQPIATGCDFYEGSFESCGFAWIMAEDGTGSWSNNNHFNIGGTGLDTNFGTINVPTKTPTGTTSSGSFIVTGVSSFTGVQRYMPISGPGIPAGTHIFDMNTGGGTITLSQPAAVGFGAGTLTIGYSTAALVNIGGNFNGNTFYGSSGSWLADSLFYANPTSEAINAAQFQNNAFRGYRPAYAYWQHGIKMVNASASLSSGTAADLNYWDAPDGTAGVFAKVNGSAAAVGPAHLLTRQDATTVALYPHGSTTAEVAGVNSHRDTVAAGDIFALVERGSCTVAGQSSVGGQPAGWVKPDANVDGSLSAAAAAGEMTAPRIGVVRGNGTGTALAITASATNSSAILTGVSSFADIAVGTPLFGTGFPGGATVLGWIDAGGGTHGNTTGLSANSSLLMSAAFTGTTGSVTVTVGYIYQVKLKGIA